MVGGTTCMLSPRFGKVSEKSDGRIKSYKAKSVILDDLGLFGAFLTPFGPLGTRQGFCPKNFLQCKTTYENTTCHKISEKSNGRFSGNKPDGRTGLITIVPFRLKSGD